MIRRLRGEVIERTATSVTIDVNGVGYHVTVTKRASFPIGSKVDLHVHTHVREDALLLFGFTDPLEREIFDLLITVPTVGPVKAMGILETAPEEIVEHVRKKDLARLSKLPGVGKKTAERLVVDLADKIASLTPPGTAARSSDSQPPVPIGAREDLTSALVNLGFRPAAANDAAERAIERAGAQAGLEILLREALTQLTPR